MSTLQDALNAGGVMDCAIIGGGVSGLYTGWRLLQDKRYQNVAVFELSDRIGGRLLTWLPYGKEVSLRAELGGMRFYQEQQLVWNLIEHLGLAMTDFFTSGPNLIWYLRGLRTAAGDAQTATQRYLLNPEEQGKGPDDLLRRVIAAVLETAENQLIIQHYLGGRQPQSRQDWDRIKPYLIYQGRPLWDFSFWNIMSDILSYEASQYAGDAFGYYGLISNWNAAEAMQSLALKFTQNPAYKTLVEGFSQLPCQLGSLFQQAGGQVHLNSHLLWFEADSNGLFTLSLRGSDGDAVGHARQLVLALPRWSLEMLQPSKSFDLQRDQELKYLLDSVVGIPALKLFFLYDQRWWEKLPSGGIFQGRSVCDLPIRQTYYFRPDACEAGAYSDYGLLMASYDDTRMVDYWKGMEDSLEEKIKDQRELHQLFASLPLFLSGRQGVATDKPYNLPPNLYKAPQLMIQHAREQLALLHGVNVQDIPEPVVGAYADWSREPFDGGWHRWRPQVNVKQVMQRMKRPLGNQHEVYIVGEAYSGMQGWVEGALTATEVVLQQEFKLKWPEWLPADYYLGW
jgi:hypothetical protein